jgi:hypothetical protein
MKKYGKIVCGALRVPQNYPSYIELDGQKVCNPTEEQLEAAGYLPIEEKAPTEKVGKVAVATYKVSKDGTKIVQSWQYVDEPEPMHEEEAKPTTTEEQ